MFVIVNLATKEPYSVNGKVEKFQYEDNAQEVAQDLNHAESESDVIYGVSPAE
jgi:hypothetical protein